MQPYFIVFSILMVLTIIIIVIIAINVGKNRITEDFSNVYNSESMEKVSREMQQKQMDEERQIALYKENIKGARDDMNMKTVGTDETDIIKPEMAVFCNDKNSCYYF